MTDEYEPIEEIDINLTVQITIKENQIQVIDITCEEGFLNGEDCAELEINEELINSITDQIAKLINNDHDYTSFNILIQKYILAQLTLSQRVS